MEVIDLTLAKREFEYMYISDKQYFKFLQGNFETFQTVQMSYFWNNADLC